MAQIESTSTSSEIRRRLYSNEASRSEIQEQLIDFLEKSGDILPAAGSPLGLLGRELYREQIAMDRCEQIIATDASLTHLVLRAANQAALGSRRFTLYYAVMFLGQSRLRLLFGVEVLKRMRKEKLGPAWGAFWERNLFVARLLDQLSAQYHPVDGTEYLAGLLHDASWPAVTTFFKTYCGVSFDDPKTIFALDRDLFETSHVSISAAMCLRSGLPDHVVEAIQRHHDTVLPDKAEIGMLRYNGPFLSVLLRVANLCADACGCLPGGPGPVTASMDEVMRSPEIAWLTTNYGLPLGMEAMVEEELAQVRKTRDLFQATA